MTFDEVFKQERDIWLDKSQEAFREGLSNKAAGVEHWRETIPRRLTEEGIEIPNWFSTMLTSEFMRYGRYDTSEARKI